MSDTPAENARYGEPVTWQPETPRIGLLRFLLAWLVGALAVGVAVWLTPGTSIGRPGSAIVVAAVVGVLNAVLPPALAALRLPFMLVTGFLLVLAADALLLLIAAEILAEESTSAASATR